MKRIFTVTLLTVSLFSCTFGLKTHDDSQEVKLFDNKCIKTIKNYNEKKELHGDYKEYYSDSSCGFFKKKGDLKKLSKYKNGKLDGKSFLFNRYGEITLITQFKDGIIFGIEKKFNCNSFQGCYLESKNSYDSKGSLIGIVTYHQNGEKKMVTTYKDGKSHGEGYVYNNKGELEKTVNHKNGKLHGEQILYGKYRIKKELLNYKDGKLHGLSRKTLPNKEIEEAYFDSDNLQKIIIYYPYPSTQIKKVVQFKNFKPHGKAYEYYKNGKIKMQLNFLNGDMHGVSRIYSQNGKLVDKVMYIKGKPTK